MQTDWTTALHALYLRLQTHMQRAETFMSGGGKPAEVQPSQCLLQGLTSLMSSWVVNSTKTEPLKSLLVACRLKRTPFRAAMDPQNLLSCSIVASYGKGVA